MIIAGQLLLTDGPGRARIAPGHVRLRDEIIEEVAEGEIPPAFDLGSHHALIVPAFIDTHLHLPQFGMIGAHGRCLLEWLNEVTFPSECKWEDAAYADAMTERAVDQLFAHGTTAVCAFSSVHGDATRRALNVAKARGLRGLVGQSLMNRQAPKALCRPAKQLLDETADLLDRYPTSGRIAAAVTPRFAVSCTPDLLAQAGRLARERSAYIQSHLAESRRECELVAQLFGGSTYTQIYREFDLLTERSIHGHGVHLDSASSELLRESGAIVAHCPTANTFLRAGIMNRKSLLRHGVSLSLGSDIGAGYERSMVRVARAMVEAATTLGDHFPTAAEAWWQITAGNAEALGWHDAGSLRVGAPADLVLIQPDIPWLEPPVDPLARLLFSWDDRWLKRTWAEGRLVFAST